MRHQLKSKSLHHCQRCHTFMIPGLNQSSRIISRNDRQSSRIISRNDQSISRKDMQETATRNIWCHVLQTCFVCGNSLQKPASRRSDIRSINYRKTNEPSLVDSQVNTSPARSSNPVALTSINSKKISKKSKKKNQLANLVGKKDDQSAASGFKLDDFLADL